MAEPTPAERAAAAIAFEQRELGHVVESARLVRIKAAEAGDKVVAADALVEVHRARVDAAHAAYRDLTAGASSSAVVGAAALDATVHIREN